MSEMEYNKGRLILVSIDLESFAKEKASFSKNKKAKTDPVGWFTDAIDDDILPYLIYKDYVFEIDFNVRQGSLEDGFDRMTKDSEGIFSFETYHYNGGAHYTELLEEHLDEYFGEDT